MQFTKLLPQGLLSDTETLHLKEYRFIKYFFLLLMTFSLYHLFVWVVWTSKIFDADPYYVGDLSFDDSLTLYGLLDLVAYYNFFAVVE